MSLLLNVIFATHARSTHHKLALDALRHLEGTNMDRWADTLISQHAAYLQGAKAPDDDFKDFKNHVLHVRENFWGGAVNSAHHWYGQLVDHLRGSEWKDAAYAAGVLSHYYTDPLMPFHTGQSEAEGAVHRAAEWSVTKSYESLRSLIGEKLGGYPNVDVPVMDDWLGEMVRNGARLSNQYYDLVVDHYNLAVGVKDPPNGFDDIAREALAKCLAHATIGLARILERAFEESLVPPPEVKLTLPALVATINVPYQQIVKKLADSKDRKEVEAIFREVQETGKAIHSLPESERLVRQFHAAEVLKVPLSVLDREKPRAAGSMYVPRVAVATKESDSVKESLQGSPPSRSAMPAEVSAELNPPKPKLTPEPPKEPAEILPLVTSQVAAVTKSSENKVAPVAALAQSIVPAKIAQAAMPPTRENAVTPPASEDKGSATITPTSKTMKSVPEPNDKEPVAETPDENTRTVSTPKTAARRFHLRLDAPIVDAPSIGPKTATKFHQIGLKTIAELLECDPEETVRKLSTRHITVNVLRDWQSQSSLMVDVPGLRGHDAQLLVAADVRDRSSLMSSSPETLLEKVLDIAGTAHGRSILRDGFAPDLEEVEGWVAAASEPNSEESTRPLPAARSLAG